MIKLYWSKPVTIYRKVDLSEPYNIKIYKDNEVINLHSYDTSVDVDYDLILPFLSDTLTCTLSIKSIDGAYLHSRDFPLIIDLMQRPGFWDRGFQLFMERFK